MEGMQSGSAGREMERICASRWGGIVSRMLAEKLRLASELIEVMFCVGKNCAMSVA